MPLLDQLVLSRCGLLFFCTGSAHQPCLLSFVRLVLDNTTSPAAAGTCLAEEHHQHACTVHADSLSTFLLLHLEPYAIYILQCFCTFQPYAAHIQLHTSCTCPAASAAATCLHAVVNTASTACCLLYVGNNFNLLHILMQVDAQLKPRAYNSTAVQSHAVYAVLFSSLAPTKHTLDTHCILTRTVQPCYLSDMTLKCLC